MTVVKPPSDFVIRLGQVVIGRDELTNALGSNLDRYEQSRDGSSIYAQIGLPNRAYEWQDVAQFLDKVGPRIKSLIAEGSVGSACMDFAVLADVDSQAKFFTIPAGIAEKAGRHAIDIEVSVYMSGREGLNVYY